MCGNTGEWGLENVDLLNFDGCIETPMCEKPAATDSHNTMVLLPYYEIDNSGSVNGGESVFYKCKDVDYRLDDNSGLAVYEVHCNVSDPGAPWMPDPSTWPKCTYQPMCTEIPEPDGPSLDSGLARDPEDTRTALLPGEFVIYNCTNEYQPVTDTGSFYSLECINGQFFAPPNEQWPICRELAP